MDKIDMKYIQNNAKFQIFPHIDIYRLPLVGKKGPGEGLNSSNLVKISSILAIFGTGKWWNCLKSINIVRSHKNTLNLSKIIPHPVIWRPKIGQNGPKNIKKWSKSTKNCRIWRNFMTYGTINFCFCQNPWGYSRNDHL